MDFDRCVTCSQCLIFYLLICILFVFTWLVSVKYIHLHVVIHVLMWADEK